MAEASICTAWRGTHDDLLSIMQASAVMTTIIVSGPLDRMEGDRLETLARISSRSMVQKECTRAGLSRWVVLW
jgi:hypothetical protein